MQTLYTALKVNNEMELCEIYDMDCRKEIERSLLKNRISYFIRWPKQPLFKRRKDTCIICINDNVIEMAEELVRSICDEHGYQVKFLMRHSANRYL